MQAIKANSHIFEKEQKLAFQVEVWDTPYTVLENNIASGGIAMDLVCPNPDDSFDALDVVRTNANTDISADFLASGNAVVTDGRTDNLVRFWSGGAPAEHGATHNARVAYHFHGELRSVAGRSWFSSDATPTWFLALAGQGYFRIDKTVGGVVTTIFSQPVTEQDFLDGGLHITPVINDMQEGDALDIYYVQEASIDPWGGFVIKAVAGAPTISAGIPSGRNALVQRTLNQQRAKDAPVLGCGLIDDGDATKQTPVILKGVTDVAVTRKVNVASTATFSLPLINSASFDGVGWEYVKNGHDDPGELRWWYGGEDYEFALKRQRLVRITIGFEGEMYDSFVGLLHDYDKLSGGLGEVQCIGFESILLEQYDKNFPDKISYMGHSFRKLTGTTEPAYDTPAFDNWPVEDAIYELLSRKGIDASRLHRSLTVPVGNIEVPVVIGGETYRKFRARSFSGKKIKLERAVHYGNNGVTFNESQPPDDPYIAKPENTKEIWKRVQDFADNYGYDLTFDEHGDCLLQPRNNPHAVFDLTPDDVVSGAVVKDVNPSAYGGVFLQSEDAVTIRKTVVGSRIDVCIPVAPGMGNITASVYEPGDLVNPIATPVVLVPNSSDEAFFYDFRATVDGTNATIATVFSGEFGTYVVELVGATAEPRRFDTVFTYHTDPMTTLLPVALDTQENAITAVAEGGMDDMRNFVTVIGRDKGARTDDEKLALANNPVSERVISRAVNVGSIVDPNDPTFIGRVRESVLYSENITDDDFAAYLGRTFIYRQRVPAPTVPVQHSLLPVVQLRDPVLVNETRYKTVSAESAVFVRSITHRVSLDKATTDIEATGYPEFPAYEPRQDIDIDQPEFGGIPLLNIDVSYVSLSGHVKHNLGADTPYVHSDSDIVRYPAVKVERPVGGTPYIDFQKKTSSGWTRPGTYAQINPLPWPPAPGSLMVQPNGVDVTEQQLLTVRQGEVWYRKPGVSGPPIAVPGWTGFQHIYAIEKHTDSWGRNRFGRWYEVTTNWFDCPVGFYYIFDPAQQTVTLRRSPDYPQNPLEPFRYECEIRYYGGALGPGTGFKANNPYHHFYNIDYRSREDGGGRVYLPWHQGDAHPDHDEFYRLPSEVQGMAVIYRSLFPLDEATNTYKSPYPTSSNILGISQDESPFYDPYTSELGYVVSVKFDALVSGLYRVSIRHRETHQVVAWLTEPTGDPAKAESHWAYMGAGVGKQFMWDGVDNVGSWNISQSEPYQIASAGEFSQEEPKPIGKGYYVWNQERKGGTPGPLALISGECDPDTGKPVFGVGTYGEFYVQVEVQNDTLEEVAEANPLSVAKQVPRVFRTTQDNKTADGTVLPKLYLTGAQAIIYTHLPSPTMLNMEVKDWTSGTAFDPDEVALINTESNWGAPDTDATVHNEKPVRIRFAFRNRPGVLWTGKQDAVQGKLSRLVHPRVTIFDQIVVWSGSNYAGTNVLDRAVTNRTLTNDSHTFNYTDTGFRRNDSFKTATRDGSEWIFYPALLKKNWRGVEEEPMNFGDYLQLEEVPKWDLTRQVGSTKSRMQIAFMSYLFYLSAYVTDRSGRMTWAVNPSFLDKSKIIYNDYSHWWKPDAPTVAANASTFEIAPVDDPMTQHRRTVICRQWTNEPGWVSAQKTKWGFATGSIGEQLLRHKWVEHDPGNTDRVDGSGNLIATSWSTYGLEKDEYSERMRHYAWLDYYKTNDGWKYPAEATMRQLGEHASGTSMLGSWTWERDPLWVPCVTRDFHPYFLVPPMMWPRYDKTEGPSIGTVIIGGIEVPLPGEGGYRRRYNYLIVDGNDYNGDKNTGADPAAYDNWHSAMFDMTEAVSDNTMFRPGTKCQQNQDPFKALVANNMDYIRQDESVHWEDLRGIISSSSRPGEQPKKITPVQPYYINQWNHGTIYVRKARYNKLYPRFDIAPTNFFAMKFRSEYLWESGTLFPVTNTNREMLEAMNIEKNQINLAQLWPRVRYDSGAWTGWKDDANYTSSTDASQKKITLMFNTNENAEGSYKDVSPFDYGFMPIAIGPKLPETKEMYFHMVLVNERRELPVDL